MENTNHQLRKAVAKLSHSGRFRKLVVALVIAVTFLGLIIYPIERGAEGALIQSEGDGLWFAVTTVTGVGYGDMVPVTSWGRVVAVLLEVFGVVIFGSVMAFVAVELLRYQEDFNMRRILERQDMLDKKIDELRKEIGFLVKK